MRTPEERAEAVERLKENKRKTARMSFFGEDNHAKIDAMIDVIENDRSEKYIYSNFESEDEEEDSNGDTNDLVQSALSAREFLDGINETEDLLYPES